MPWAATPLNPTYWAHLRLQTSNLHISTVDLKVFMFQAVIAPPLPAQIFVQPMVESVTVFTPQTAKGWTVYYLMLNSPEIRIMQGFVPPPPVPGVPTPTMFKTDQRADTAQPPPPKFHQSQSGMTIIPVDDNPRDEDHQSLSTTIPGWDGMKQLHLPNRRHFIIISGHNILLFLLGGTPPL
ncbi:hypothetical protein MLD38_033334 [Melastoma candidum]|uniref:Uncharacterized protein n=1 Tax=Melastoma candidum TaxID=119954 RepID=A0ACB9M8P1_9MYRT|nr:hypothetical protein MLD38_033334 [Melastoma candidum]